MESTGIYNYLLYPGNHPENIKKALQERACLEEQQALQNNLSNISFIWKPTNFTPLYYAAIDQINSTRPLSQHIVLNHFENLKGICTKNELLKSLRKYYSTTSECVESSYHVFMSTPTSFIIQSGCSQDYISFIHRFKNICYKNYKKESMPAKHCEENLWLVKPSNLNQGKGIEIFRNHVDIQAFIESKQPHSKWIVQKYIEKPLLYEGRKFDIRVWALVASNGNLYYYKHGYLRTSSDKFTLENSEKWVHLTNNCFQCFGDKYGAYESGNTLPFDSFRDYLKKVYPHHDVDFDKHIVPRIKDLIIDTFLSVKQVYNPNGRKNSFELLGYDFMIDEDLRVWLIECNENPYIGVPNNYIKQMLPIMLSSMLSIVLDPVLNLQPIENETSWELLYSEKIVDQRVTINTNQRRPYNTSLYPIAELMPPKNDQRILPFSVLKSQHKAQVSKTNADSACKLVQVDGRPRLDSFSKIDHKTYTLTEMMNQLLSNFKEKLFDKCYTQIYNKLVKSSSYTNAEVGEATNCLKKMYKKHIDAFTNSSHCVGLITYYLDFTNVRVDAIHDVIMEIVNSLLKELIYKRVFYENSVMVSIRKTVVLLCFENACTNRVKQIIDLIISLGNFDKLQIYIPGLSSEVDRQRKLYLTNGLLILLFHLKNESKSNDVIQYIQFKLQLVDIKAFEKQLENLSAIIKVDEPKEISNTLRECNVPVAMATNLSAFTKKNSKSSADIDKPSTDISSSEVIKGIAGFNLPKIYHQLHGLINEINEKNKQRNIESIKWKQLQNELLAKKLEEENKQKEEIKFKAIQTLFQRYEEIKKQKIEQMQIESVQKEEIIKRRECKRKQKIEECKKREAERKRMQDKLTKKRVDKEKYEYQEWQKISVELHQKKAISLIKKRFTNPTMTNDNDRILPSVSKEFHRSSMMNGKSSPYITDLEETPKIANRLSIKRCKKRPIDVDDISINLFRVYNTTLHKTVIKKKNKNWTVIKNSKLIFQV